MSYLNALAVLPWDWVVFGGGLGGALNAAASSNLRLFPSWASNVQGDRLIHLTRLGLLANSSAGATASAGLLWTIRGLADLDALRADWFPARLVALALFVGFLTARGITSEIDKVLLRLAVRNAAAAPAAHPEVAEALHHAPPYAVYKIATELAPRRRHAPPGHIDRRPAFNNVQPQS